MVFAMSTNWTYILAYILYILIHYILILFEDGRVRDRLMMFKYNILQAGKKKPMQDRDEIIKI
jgi:hypothetical protein